MAAARTAAARAAAARAAAMAAWLAREEARLLGGAEAAQAAPDLSEDREPTPLVISGYVRFFVQGRSMNRLFPDETAGVNFVVPNQISVGGFSAREPTIRFDVSGNPTASSFLRAEYYLFSPYTGSFERDTQNNLNLYQTITLAGGVTTDAGRFNLTAGGLTWYRLSPFTLWGYETATYRIFSRAPWAPEGRAAGRYEGFYNLGLIDRDARFGRQPVAGFVFEGTGLPGRTSASVIYGKTNFSGGPGSFAIDFPRAFLGGRFGFPVRTTEVGLNAIGQFGFTDLSGRDRDGWQVATADARFTVGSLVTDGFVEAGVGSYYSPSYGRGSSPLGFLDLTFDPGVGLNLRLYHVGESVVNLNGIFQNASVPEAGAQFNAGGQGLVESAPIGSAVTEVGQMSNNRQGASLRTLFALGPLKFNLAAEVEREIQGPGDLRSPITEPQLAFPHPLVPDVRADFQPFQAQTGPYGRLFNFFRFTFEQIPLTGPRRLEAKGFNSLEGGVKTKIGDYRALILSYYGTYNTVQHAVRALPQPSRDALLRAHYSEANAYWIAHPRVVLIGFAGLERTISNDGAQPLLNPDTPDDAVRRSIDQFGVAAGVGIDYDFSERIGLYLRLRRFEYEDRNFPEDQFNGWQASVELKAFF